MPRPSRQQVISTLPAEAIAHYVDNAHDYVRDLICDGDNLITSQQKDGLDAISKYQRVLIASGKGTGKTAFFTWVIDWFLDTRPAKCRIPVTAPTERGIQKNLWPEIQQWLKKSKVGDHFLWQAESFRHRIDPINKFASYQASKEAENIRGQHAEHLLYLLEEVFGITNREVFQEIEFSLSDVSGDNKLLAGGNYTNVDCWAHEQITRYKHLWQPPDGIILSWNAEESPLANKKHIFDMKARWGRDHDVYRSLVLGLPPLGSPKAFIKLSDLNEAIGRDVPLEGAIELAVDPARFGDDLTCIGSRFGYTMFPLLHCDKTDEVQIYNMVINTVQTLRGKFGYNARIKVKVLTTGGLGSGCYDLLKRDKENNIEAISIIESLCDDPHYHDVLSVMYGEFRDQLGRINLPDDVDLIGELSSRNFDIILKNNKTRLEPKKEFKRRLGHSPDRSDCTVTLFSNKAAKKKKIEFYPAAYTFDVLSGIRWEALDKGITPMVSLWADADMKLGVLLSLWNAHTGQLSVFGEKIFDTPAPEVVLPAIDRIINHITNGFTNRSRFEWFGNRAFFSGNGGDTFLAYSRQGQNIRKNMSFDDLGSVMFIGGLISRGRFMIDSRLGSLPYAIAEWDVDSADDDSRFILCRSLCLLGSVLQSTGMATIQKPTSIAYTESRAKKHNELSRLAQEDRLKEASEGYGGTPGPSDWMTLG